MPDLFDTIAERIASLGPPVRLVAGQRSSVAIRRYVEGVTGAAELRKELALLGYGGLLLERLALSADMELDLARRRGEADVAEADFRRGLLDQGTLKARFIEAGFSEPMAILMVQTTKSKAAPPRARVTSIGLVLVPEPAGVVEERPRRHTSIGLVLTSDPSGAVREAGPRPTSIGLVMAVGPESEVEELPRRPTSIGLVLAIPAEGAVREATPRPTAIGFTIEVRK